jgi:hypothetical protein
LQAPPYATAKQRINRQETIYVEIKAGPNNA